MTSSADKYDLTANHCRMAFLCLCQAAQDMIYSQAKPIPSIPDRFNLLARPYSQSEACSVCFLPSHHSVSVEDAELCVRAIRSNVGFWEDIASHILYLYKHHSRFADFVKQIEADYAMRLNEVKPIPGPMEKVVLHRITANYLRFQSHWLKTRNVANEILPQNLKDRYEHISKILDEYLLHGLTLMDLYKFSVEKSQQQQQ